MLFEARLRDLIQAHRRAFVPSQAARLASRYLNAWHNTGFYDFQKNGERFAVEAAVRRVGGQALRVWDVGAHAGEYAAEVHAVDPNAKVTSFEIIPAIAEEIRRRNFDPAWFELKTVGLSDQPGTLTMTWNKRFHTMNTAHPSSEEHFAHDETETVVCKSTTVDALIGEGAPPPHLLKLDVEGHEAAVLAGAESCLRSAEPPLLVQFEYGVTWIPAGRTLYEVQRKLEAMGYSVGRLYRDHVDFRPYALRDEHFRMGNMVATRDPALRETLGGRRR